MVLCGTVKHNDWKRWDCGIGGNFYLRPQSVVYSFNKGKIRLALELIEAYECINRIFNFQRIRNYRSNF